MIVEKLENLLRIIQNKNNCLYLNESIEKFYVNEEKTILFEYSFYSGNKILPVCSINFLDKYGRKQKLIFYINTNNNLEILKENRFRSSNFCNEKNKIENFLINEFPKKNLSFKKLLEILDFCILKLL